MNHEHGNTGPTPKASLLLMEDNLCKRGSVISRNSSVGVSSRIFYYYHHLGLDGGVPFKWEMQPGTPINPQPEEIVPPLTPPPALLSRSLTKPSFGESNKHSLFPANLKVWKWKNLRNRYFSKWSSQSILSRDYKNAHHGDSSSCGESERVEESEDYRSTSSSSSSSSSSKDRRLVKASPRLWFSGGLPRNLKNTRTGFR
ncbi:Transmembrane protein [Hirschfeldia incana]|nr:Transmembrane protein [Hirschfeldia incana]